MGFIGLGGLCRVEWLCMVGLVGLGLNWIVFLTIAHADSTLSLYLIKCDIILTPVIQDKQ